MMTQRVNELFQYFCATCLLFVPVFCGLEKTCTPEVKARGPQGMCGRALTEILSSACVYYGGYYSQRHKRAIGTELSAQTSEASAQTTARLIPKLPTVKDLQKQFVSKRQAFAFLMKRTEFNERGVVCECCYFQCGWGEITQYCSSDYMKRSHLSNIISPIDTTLSTGNIRSDSKTSNGGNI